MSADDELMDIDSAPVQKVIKASSGSRVVEEEDQVMESIESTNGSSAAGESDQSTATSLPSSEDNLPPIDDQVGQILSLAKAHEWRNGQVAYLVSKQWLWRPISRSSLASTLGKPPKDASNGKIGPVDNSSITSQTEDALYKDLQYEDGLPFVPLRDDLEEKEDYEFLPKEAWDLLIKWYGLADGSSAITRVSRTAPEEVDPQASGTIELHPPVFLLRKLSADVSESRTQAAPRILSSIHEPFRDFLLRAKPLLRIAPETEVRTWALDETQKESESTLGTPLTSRNVSPAPKSKVELDLNKNLSIEMSEFISFRTPLQRDLLSSKDPSVFSQDGDHSSVSAKGLSKSGIYILEERIGGPGGGEWPSDLAPQNGSAQTDQVQPNDRVSLLKSGQAKSDSHVGGGIMTRGRALKSGQKLGKCGLVNLGNTCYMNSALQCIRSVEELTKYFLTDKYLEELNYDNPLAYNGDVAKSYGHLMHQIYKKDFSGPFSPRQFKAVIGRCNTSFLGYGQQDSQEFLGFLLDALNEDLCRIKKKPYFSHPDSTPEHVENPNALRDLATQVWEGHVSRNESVVTDLFAGLYKSTLVCPVCGKISITFDPFNTLTLQLPQPPFRKEVYFNPLNGPFMKMTVELDKHSSIRSLKDFVSKRMKVEVERLQVSEAYSHKFYRHYTDAEDATECIQSSDDIVVYELEVPASNVPEPGNPGMVDFSSLDAAKLDYMLVPVLSMKANGLSSSAIGLPLFIMLTPEESRNYDTIFRKVLQKIGQSTTFDLFKGMGSQYAGGSVEDHEMVSAPEGSDMSSSMDIKATCVEGDDGFVNVSKASGEESSSSTPHETHRPRLLNQAILDPNNPIPEELVNAFKLFVWKGEGELLASKTPGFNLNSTTLKSRLPRREEDISSDDDSPPAVSETPSDEISQSSPNAYAKALAERSPIASDEDEDDDELLAHNAGKSKIPQRRDSNDFMSMEPLIYPGEGLVIDFSAGATEMMYDGTDDDNSTHQGQYVWEHAIPFHDKELERKDLARQKVRKHGILLEDCLDEFEREEVLSEQDQWYCNKCKLHRRATKQLELWKTPDILVVHLKRFSAAVRAFRDKIDTLVQFPVNDLDLTKRVRGKEDGKEYVYDLFAVDNHYGGLGGGHYTAFARNFVSGMWHDYNDASVSQVKNVESVVTSAAYLLFYRRRSESTLGGPLLAEVVEAANRSPPQSPSDSRAQSPSALAGEGQRLGDSSLNGSSSASQDRGAAAHSAGAGSTGGTAATALSRATATIEGQELPEYSELADGDDQAGIFTSGSHEQGIVSLTEGNWNWDNIKSNSSVQGEGSHKRAGSVTSAIAGSQMSNPDDRMKDFEDDDANAFEFNESPARDPGGGIGDSDLPDLEEADAAIDLSADMRISNTHAEEMEDPPVVEISVEKDEGLNN